MTTLAPTLVDPFAADVDVIRELVEGTAPAAGADFSLTMEGRYLTRLLSLRVFFDTDANAADREVVLEYRNDQNLRYALMGAPVTVSANDTVDYLFQRGQGQAEWPVDDTIIVPLLPYVLPPGHNLRLHVVNVQAGDALTGIRLYWERFRTDEYR